MLHADSLTKHFGPHVALQSLDLTVPAGEVFCLLGGNGAGKSTTIHLFMGFLRPTDGAAYVDGYRVDKNIDQVRRRVAYVPENVSLYSMLTGYENLEYFTRLARVEAVDRSTLVSWLDRVALDESARNQRVATYSKGMRQKVGLAIALARGARALILDEPLSGLDPEAANHFCRLVRGLASEGVAVLMATHDLFRSKQVGDRVGIMRLGAMRSTLATDGLAHDTLEEEYLRIMEAPSVVRSAS